MNRQEQIQMFMAGLIHEQPLLEVKTGERRKVFRTRRKTAIEILTANKCKHHNQVDPREWPDYERLLKEKLRERRTELFSVLLARWENLLDDPWVQNLYVCELKSRRAQSHRRNTSVLERRARTNTLRKLLQDLRALGRFELMIYGKTTFGYPTSNTAS